MDKKMYKMNGYDIFLEKNNYANNGRLAVEAYCVEKCEWCDDAEMVMPYATITTNLTNETVTDENCAFVDTNNVFLADAWLEENGIAEPTGRYGFSGFCCYPEMRFFSERM